MTMRPSDDTRIHCAWQEPLNQRGHVAGLEVEIHEHFASPNWVADCASLMAAGGWQRAERRARCQGMLAQASALAPSPTEHWRTWNDCVIHLCVLSVQRGAGTQRALQGWQKLGKLASSWLQQQWAGGSAMLSGREAAGQRFLKHSAAGWRHTQSSPHFKRSLT